MVKGPLTYLLNEHEELWDKILPPEVEMLLDLNIQGAHSTSKHFAVDYHEEKIGRKQTNIR